MDENTLEGDYKEAWQRWYKYWQDISFVNVNLFYEPDMVSDEKIEKILKSLNEKFYFHQDGTITERELKVKKSNEDLPNIN